MSETNPYEPPESPSEPVPALRGKGVGIAAFSFLLNALMVMLPWPVLGIVLGYSLVDHPLEYAFVFGGVTGILLLPLGLLDLPDAVYPVLIVLVWVAFLVVPAVLLARRKAVRKLQIATLVLQSVFAAVQAAMGLLILIGKGV